MAEANVNSSLRGSNVLRAALVEGDAVMDGDRGGVDAPAPPPKLGDGGRCRIGAGGRRCEGVVATAAALCSGMGSLLQKDPYPA